MGRAIISRTKTKWCSVDSRISIFRHNQRKIYRPGTCQLSRNAVNEKFTVCLALCSVRQNPRVAATVVGEDDQSTFNRIKILVDDLTRHGAERLGVMPTYLKT